MNFPRECLGQVKRLRVEIRYVISGRARLNKSSDVNSFFELRSLLRGCYRPNRDPHCPSRARVPLNVTIGDVTVSGRARSIERRRRAVFSVHVTRCQRCIWKITDERPEEERQKKTDYRPSGFENSAR